MIDLHTDGTPEGTQCFVDGTRVDLAHLALSFDVDTAAPIRLSTELRLDLSAFSAWAYREAERANRPAPGVGCPYIDEDHGQCTRLGEHDGPHARFRVVGCHVEIDEWPR